MRLFLARRRERIGGVFTRSLLGMRPREKDTRNACRTGVLKVFAVFFFFLFSPYSTVRHRPVPEQGEAGVLEMEFSSSMLVTLCLVLDMFAGRTQ